LSGLGLVVARWLGERGAGRVVLVSRRGVTDEATPVIADLRASGVDVIAESADVSNEAAMTALIDRLRASGPPLRGVIHSAGTLDDAGIPAQTSESFRRVFAPKVAGGFLLDRLTRPDPLDWFVLFSSIASVLGGRGQANHSAASTFLDVLAHERQANGLPGLSINWGPWSDTGAAVDRGAAERLATQGVSAMTPAQGLQALERLLAHREIAQAVVLIADWNRYLASQQDTPRTLLSHLIVSAAAASHAATPAADRAPAGVRAPGLREQLATTPPARRRAIVQAFVRERAQRALGLDPNRSLDPRTPLGELGLDSLLAVELRNTLGASLGTTLPATLMFDHPTVDALTDHLLHDVLGEPVAAVEPTIVAPATVTAPSGTLAGALVNSIEAMSDDEVERLLANRGKRR
jgi:acyl carrier protein